MLVCPDCGHDKFTVEAKSVTTYKNVLASRIAIRGAVNSNEVTVEYMCENCGKTVTPVDNPVKRCKTCGILYYGSHECNISF